MNTHWILYLLVFSFSLIIRHPCLASTLLCLICPVHLFLSHCLSERNETRSVIRIKVLHILSFVLSTNRQLYEVCTLTHRHTYFCILTFKCAVSQLVSTVHCQDTDLFSLLFDLPCNSLRLEVSYLTGFVCFCKINVWLFCCCALMCDIWRLFDAGFSNSFISVSMPQNL